MPPDMHEARFPPSSARLKDYRRQEISPAQHDLRDIDAHFDRRDYLYRSLKLPPIAFKGADVLEVAAGSGHNSLYIAVQRPQAYDLVEPNPIGVSDIHQLYAAFDLPHTKPQVFQEAFGTFAAPRLYDIVLCENWLGGDSGERALHLKLANLIRPGGTLVTTFVPHSGFAPNVLRHLLAQRLMDQAGVMSFEAQTSYLVEIFEPHLASLTAMTRSHADWVRDCLQNPAYLSIALSLDVLIERVGAEMDALSFSPRFSIDWRGAAPNAVATENYLMNLHNFIDWTSTQPPRPAATNKALDVACRKLHATASAWMDERNTAAGADVANATSELVDQLATSDPQQAEAFAEALAIWRKPVVCAREVRHSKKFGPLFGRESIYASFTRKL